MFDWSKENKEKMEDKPNSQRQRIIEKSIYVTYTLRNGKSWDFSIDYNVSDYRGAGDYDAAVSAMNKEVIEKKENIDALIQENLGQESGWVKLGNTYVANRDLATVNIRVIETTNNWMDW